VADERKRIAQDIHDGVGSQLVGLIASLDASSPHHKRLHLGLECCLLDLKMTVDNMDSGDTNIFDALGSLRYRFTPSLMRAGIRMVWRVDTAGPLLAVPQARVAHVMRITQECLANVLVHSQAKTVRLICRYEQAPPRMLLEVQDDGVGMVQDDDGGWIGKGLSGMRERAKSLGAQLQIDTQKGAGTRVRLQVPVH
jgi:signal transduction histidine kinase